MIQNIIIIGTGWYGCYAALLLKNKYNITIIEQKSDIFDNSSYYNQNRLHLGYHYPRNYNTRILCKKYFYKFKEKFGELLNNITNNYYLISNESLIDLKTYNSIYRFEGYEFNTIKNDTFDNIYDEIFIVDEEVINSEKTKNYFKKNLNCNIIFNKKVTSIINKKNISVILDDLTELNCDLVIDCTYNQLGLSNKKYTYEKTISLLFEKINNINFNAITIMDGDFSSLYPRDIDNNIYTLTDVEYTPFYKSDNIDEVNNYVLGQEELENIKNNMINKFSKYYKDFITNFEYKGYFISNKTKLISGSCSRECIIENNKNIISVNCGKIIGIFELENYLQEINLI